LVVTYSVFLHLLLVKTMACHILPFIMMVITGSQFSNAVPEQQLRLNLGVAFNPLPKPIAIGCEFLDILSVVFAIPCYHSDSTLIRVGGNGIGNYE
jgi:hypothetical protein